MMGALPISLLMFSLCQAISLLPSSTMPLPRVFLDFTYADKPVGRVVVSFLRQQTDPQKLQLTHMQLELFTDVYVSTSHLSGRGLFVNRHR